MERWDTGLRAGDPAQSPSRKIQNQAREGEAHLPKAGRRRRLLPRPAGGGAPSVGIAASNRPICSAASASDEYIGLAAEMCRVLERDAI